MTQTPITQVKGIGPAMASMLARNGYDSAESIASSTIEALSNLPGFGEFRAKQVMASAASVVPKSKKEPSKSKSKKQAKTKTKSKDKGKKTGKSKGKSKPKKKDKKKGGKKDSKKSKSKKKKKGKKGKKGKGKK